MMYDIIVIGGGPAGMTAAIYAKRGAKSVMVLEAFAYGGQIINTPDIANYPAEKHISGFDFATKIYEQATELGAEFIFEKATEIKDGAEYKTVITESNEYKAKAVIIATGSSNKKLGIKGEDELIGRGVSYCATCDGAFYKNKNVAVVGGGNTALEDALYLSDIAAKVYIIHRRESFRGEKSTEEALRKKGNVVFVTNSVITKLISDKKLDALEVTDKSGKTMTIETDGLFVAVGRTPENAEFSSLIDIDQSGYAIAGEDCHTKTYGIFVAGDNRVKKTRQLVTAVSDGAVAATEAINYISHY